MPGYRLVMSLLAVPRSRHSALGGLDATAQAQNEQFIPALVYRTGPYAPNGIPFANGYADYLAMVNERDGGINGVKIITEECETGYLTDRGVECYERLKSKGPTGAAAFSPLSTGITYALIERAPTDKIPVVSMGYGRADSADGRVFPWVFPILGTYWTQADTLVHYVAMQEGGYDKLKGKKIAFIYHDSPYGKEPIPVFQALAKLHGFELEMYPVTPPGLEQKSTWLQLARQFRPDWTFMWGWGVMNSTAIKEAAAIGYPRDHFIGVWWSGAEPDVTPAGDGAIGYKSGAMHAAGRRGGGAPGHLQIPVRQGQRRREARRGRAGALQPRHDQRGHRRRGHPHRAGQVRQQAAHRRTGPLGSGEPQPRRQAHQGDWASTG